MTDQERLRSCLTPELPVLRLALHKSSQTLNLRILNVATGQREVHAFDNRAEALDAIASWAQDKDTVVTQGAGDVTRAAHELVSRL